MLTTAATPSTSRRRRGTRRSHKGVPRLLYERGRELKGSLVHAHVGLPARGNALKERAPQLCTGSRALVPKLLGRIGPAGMQPSHSEVCAKFVAPYSLFVAAHLQIVLNGRRNGLRHRCPQLIEERAVRRREIVQGMQTLMTKCLICALDERGNKVGRSCLGREGPLLRQVREQGLLFRRSARARLQKIRRGLCRGGTRTARRKSRPCSRT